MEPRAPSSKASAVVLSPCPPAPGLPGIMEVGSFLRIPSRTPAGCALGAGDSEKADPVPLKDPVV